MTLREVVILHLRLTLGAYMKNDAMYCSKMMAWLCKDLGQQ